MIELRGVCKTFGEGVAEVQALVDVDLSVAAGEFVVLLGPSGSGKTTLLNLIGALDTPTAGTVIVDGFEVSGASRNRLFEFRKRSVSFIFQSFNIFPGLTAAENVQFGTDASVRLSSSHVARLPASTQQPVWCCLCRRSGRGSSLCATRFSAGRVSHAQPRQPVRPPIRLSATEDSRPPA